MAQLYRFRKGWENENLAQYLLSRFSFIARPVSISDDMGTDFYGTLFQKTNDGTLLPRTAFAIQIKSHNDIASKKNRIDIADKVAYLKKLEIPFFFGVADNTTYSLTIYSGELIPRFFSFRGSPTRLTAVLCERRRYDDKRTKNDKYDLDFPKFTKLTVDMSEEDLSTFVSNFYDLCLLMHTNLSARATRSIFLRHPSQTAHSIYGCTLEAILSRRSETVSSRDSRKSFSTCNSNCCRHLKHFEIMSSWYMSNFTWN
jgi:hypothetical protein